jgi:hypothetical protein
MWAISFVVVTGSYTLLAVTVISHIVLVAAAAITLALTAAKAITVATWTAATAKPELFLFGFAWQKQDSAEGQHKH